MPKPRKHPAQKPREDRGRDRAADLTDYVEIRNADGEVVHEGERHESGGGIEPRQPDDK